MEPSRALAVCLVMAVAATAAAQQYHQPAAAYYSTNGLIFWVPMPLLAQPATRQHHSPITTFVPKAAAAAVIPSVHATANGDSVTINADTPSSPSVITQGAHLGETPDQPGFIEDTPASVITHGPNPGSYTAITSDERSESTQFHSQDGTGQFIFGHSSPEQARLESRTADGTVRGSYSYVNPEGRTIKVTYSAGENGFQPVEEPNSDVLPKPVTETPEVAAARALHARLYDQARWLAESSPEHEEHQNEQQTTPASVVQDEKPNGANSDALYQPDSLYNNIGSVAVETDDELTYYGAAKGKPIPYGVPPKPVQNNYYSTSKTVGQPLAYSGSYYFPNNQPYFPFFSQASAFNPYSLTSPFFGQNSRQDVISNLRREHVEDAAEIAEQINSEKVPSKSQNSEYNGAAKQQKLEYYGAAKPQNLEYYGAAKLLAYSAEQQLNENKQSHRQGKSFSLPKESEDSVTPKTQEPSVESIASVITKSQDPSDHTVTKSDDKIGSDVPKSKDASDSVTVEANSDTIVSNIQDADDSVGLKYKETKDAVIVEAQNVRDSVAPKSQDTSDSESVAPKSQDTSDSESVAPKSQDTSDSESVAPISQDTSDSIIVEAKSTSDSIASKSQETSKSITQDTNSDSISIEAQDTSDSVTPKSQENIKSILTPAARFSAYQQAAPVFVAVGVSSNDEREDIPSLRTALGSFASQPAFIPPVSVSQKAAYFGAVPVAAVHDAQVAPGQIVKDHQKLPVYIETH